jgi:Zn-dependent M28 family amino/carboxypeptidase
MVTARAFANVTTDRTIYFMLFSAEEQGLIGSEVFVEEYYESGEYVAVGGGVGTRACRLTEGGARACMRVRVCACLSLDIVSALTMDMIGYSNRYEGVLIEGTNNVRRTHPPAHPCARD